MKEDLNRNKRMSEFLPWVDEWIETTETLPVFSPEESQVFQKIKAHWNKKDRITFLDSLKTEYGEILNETIIKLVRENCIRDWKSIAKEKNDNSLEAFLQVLWEPMKEEGFEFSLEKTEDSCQIHCTKCPMAELASELKGEEWIYLFTCQSDYYMIEGFNPEIQFERDKTLMTNHDHCNHFYRQKKTR